VFNNSIEILERRTHMRTLIVYTSKYGFTENVAKILGDHIEGDVAIHKCDKDYSVDLTKFENVIVGSSLYVGKPNNAVLDFCEKYQRLLMSKRLGFFVTGTTGKEAVEALRLNFPEDMVKKSEAIGCFGYALNFEKMRFFDRLVTRIVLKKDQSEVEIDSEAIEMFAQKFNKHNMRSDSK